MKFENINMSTYYKCNTIHFVAITMYLKITFSEMSACFSLGNSAYLVNLGKPL